MLINVDANRITISFAARIQRPLTGTNLDELQILEKPCA
jgi:hypothetical protein